MPSPLTDEEGDFILIHHEDLRLSQKTEEVYAQLQKMLLEQHEVSRRFSSPFSARGPLQGKVWGSGQMGLDSNSGSFTYWLCDQGERTLKTGARKEY